MRCANVRSNGTCGVRVPVRVRRGAGRVVECAPASHGQPKPEMQNCADRGAQRGWVEMGWWGGRCVVVRCSREVRVVSDAFLSPGKLERANVGRNEWREREIRVELVEQGSVIWWTWANKYQYRVDIIYFQ